MNGLVVVTVIVIVFGFVIVFVFGFVCFKWRSVCTMKVGTEGSH